MIVGPCRILTGGPEPRVIENGGIQIAGAHIAQVGPIGALAAARREETLWPARGRLALPGYVNAHAHLARQLARGLALPAANWDRYDRALAPEDVHWAALAALVEGLRHGITTTCDLHRSGACLDLSLSEVTGAAAKLGVRVAAAYAAAENDPPADRRAALEECRGLAGDLRRERTGRLRALAGVRARTAEGLTALIGEAEDVAGALAVHVEIETEGAAGAGWSAEPPPRRPSLWAHAERIRPIAHDDLLGVTGPGALVPPDADMAWGSDAGVHAPPLLETGAAAPDRRSLAAHYRRVHVHGARWASRCFGEGLGTLEAGAPADLILVDYEPPTELDASTLFAHLATGIARAPVWGAMVAGEIVMDRGALVAVDEAEVAARARECSRRVWKRL